ncbi:DUF1971 domain-containing protein [Rhizobium sp. CECT 9324]|uniref:DUF1971 domain-containing protein n=1 Tax=Rhizobium sp. CECT 9324 TaxID=2845820 RepID=UPI001E491F82|nr:DUF1971 domain-containing protein [Rhizobium sp. CECT 9324]CAH0340839.1 hypothetical protein RHI9324_02521 [Rhizobium sp. CECT 9324]
MDVLTEPEIAAVVRRFYDRVRNDDLLSNVFDVVEDWDEHLIRLSEFWSSVALMSGKYKGNPLAIHYVHRDRINPEMFDRWLELWRATTEDLLCADAALILQSKAARIATKLRFSMTEQRSVTSTSNTPPLRAFKVSEDFTDQTMPGALLRNAEHDGATWALIRVAAGTVRYVENDGEHSVVVGGGSSVLVKPHVSHRLEILGYVSLRVEFYDRNPSRHQL